MSILPTNQDLKQIVLNLYAVEKVNLVSRCYKKELFINHFIVPGHTGAGFW
jgi:hypothetical protein